MKFSLGVLLLVVMLEKSFGKLIYDEQSCPGNWTKYNNRCYYFSTQNDEKLSRHDATKRCNRQGASLIVINDKTEDDWMKKKLTDESWIGLKNTSPDDHDVTRLSSTGTMYRWIDNSPLEYINRRLDRAKQGDCLTLKPNSYEWHFVSCETKNHEHWSICEKPLVGETCGTCKIYDRKCGQMKLSQLQERCDYFCATTSRESCYYVVREVLDWFGAKARCEEWGGSLAVIETNEEDVQLSKMINTDYKYWIGFRLYEKRTPYHFKWVSSAQPHYRDSVGDEAYNPIGDKDCVAIHPSGWKAESCNEKHKYICEIQYNLDSFHNEKCKDDFIEHNGRCYHFSSSKDSWDGAVKICQDRGASLIVIDNADENAWIKSKMEQQEDKSRWIGLYDFFRKTGEENDFRWIDYNYAGPNLKDSNLVESCGALTANEHYYKLLNGMNCNTMLPYICQIETAISNCRSNAIKNYHKEGKYLCMMMEPTTWAQAEKSCRNLDAKLWKIKDKTDYKHIWGLLKNDHQYADYTYWVGLYNEVQHNYGKDAYTWDTGSQVAYSNFGKFYDFSPEKCVTANIKRRWIQKNCSETHGYVCEQQYNLVGKCCDTQCSKMENGVCSKPIRHKVNIVDENGNTVADLRKLIEKKEKEVAELGKVAKFLQNYHNKTLQRNRIKFGHKLNHYPHTTNDSEPVYYWSTGLLEFNTAEKFCTSFRGKMIGYGWRNKTVRNGLFDEIVSKMKFVRLDFWLGGIYGPDGSGNYTFRDEVKASDEQLEELNNGKNRIVGRIKLTFDKKEQGTNFLYNILQVTSEQPKAIALCELV